MIAAVLIVSASIWYTNKLALKIAKEERKKVELIANAYLLINQAGDSDLNYLLLIITSNETVPIILTDNNNNIKGFKNLDSARVKNNPDYLPRQLELMKQENGPIEIDITEDLKQYIYYKDSYLLTELRYFPFIQFGIIGIFLGISYLAFSTARKAEQNQVWVGMSKETAHQLGTPISSLTAWLELLREQVANNPVAENYVTEIENDILRLELITERFSKIGSAPVLSEYNIKQDLEEIVDYFRKRASDKVAFKITTENDDIRAKINPQLFDWVIENLLKNALDAIDGVGNITIAVSQSADAVYIDVKDTGKGVFKAKIKTIFQPGYSTKKRGWGLGLSLSKRIIENYHNGKIFVKESASGKGTTFRISLPV